MQSAFRILRKSVKVLVEIVAVLVTICIAAELVLRMSSYLALEKPGRDAFEYKLMLAGRIQGYWLKPSPDHSFVPPFETYADRNYQDPERLKKIYEATKLPPSRNWASYDFLQSMERMEQTKYSIHSNSLGFRGKEADRKKPRGTFRVIVLGSYHAFGHGVNDDETYCAQLEADLNRRAPKGIKHFEVWNGGRHAGTAIIGLARLRNEIFDYDPDLLIFDYGMVDNNIWDDNFFPSPMGLPEQGIFKPLKVLLLPLLPIFQKSYLVAKLRSSLFRRTDLTRVSQFEGVLGQMASLARRHQVPFLLVKELPVTNFNEYNYLSATGVEPEMYVDVSEVFRMHPDPAATFATEKRHNDWTAELTPAELRTESAFAHHEFRLDYYQLNAHGHKVLAAALADRIEDLMKRGVIASTVSGIRPRNPRPGGAN